MIRFSLPILIILIVSAGAAFLAGGLLPYMLFFCLLFIGLISTLYLIMGYMGLKVSIEYNDRIYYAGDSEEFRTLIGCNVPLPYVAVEGNVLELSQLKCREYRGSITFAENLLLHNRITFHRRGIYNLGNLMVTMRDIFNFCHIREQIKEKINIKVYPRIYKVKNVSLIARDIYLEKSDMFSNNTDPFTVRDIRRYRRGDSLKKIHWKVSARYKNLYVKNQETISGEDIALFVDFNQVNYTYDAEGIIEELVADCALSLIDYLVGQSIDINVFLNTFKDSFFTISDRNAYDHFTEFLISQKSDGRLDFGEYIKTRLYQLNKMNRLFLVTARADERLTESAVSIKSSGFQIHIICCMEPDSHIKGTLKNHGIQITYYKDLFISRTEG